MVVGLVLGGLLVVWGGKGVVYGVVVGVVVVVVGCLVVLCVFELVYSGLVVLIFKSIVEGGCFVLGNWIMVGVMVLDMFLVLFGGVVVMLLVFLYEILYYGLEGLGILCVVLVLGLVCVGLWLVCWLL